MSVENILILAVLVVLVFIIIRFLTKILAKLIAIAAVAALIIYVLFYWNGGLANLGKDQFILYDLEEKYCSDPVDTVKCECIIQPLKTDIEANYTAEELFELRSNRKKSLDILMDSYRENQEIINNCLKEKNAGSSWKEFLEEIKSSWFKRKVDEVVEKGKEELASY